MTVQKKECPVCNAEMYEATSGWKHIPQKEPVLGKAIIACMGVCSKPEYKEYLNIRNDDCPDDCKVYEKASRLGICTDVDVIQAILDWRVEHDEVLREAVEEEKRQKKAKEEADRQKRAEEKARKKREAEEAKKEATIAKSQKKALDLADKCGAVISGHFVLAGGEHTDEYLAESAFLANASEELLELCRMMAQEFVDADIDVVVGPESGGSKLALLVAIELNKLREKKVSFAAAEKSEDEELVVRRTYAKAVDGKKVLVVDDTVTTGESIRLTCQAVEFAGGEVMHIAVFCNRGDIGDDLYNIPFFSLFYFSGWSLWSEEECMLDGPCQQKVPIDTDFGHGAEFLRRQDFESTSVMDIDEHDVTEVGSDDDIPF